MFLGDVSNDFVEFRRDGNEFHVAGVAKVDKINHFINTYKKDFSDKEYKSIWNGVGAGYMFLNLDSIRNDDMVRKYFEFLRGNYERLIQPEQDIINICSYKKIKVIPLANMVCSYIYELYDVDELEDEEFYSSQQIERAIKSPIQLHYAGHLKPWNDLRCLKSDLWLKYLVQTDFFEDYVMIKKALK